MTQDASLGVSSPRKIPGQCQGMEESFADLPKTTNMTPRPQPITAELLGVE